MLDRVEAAIRQNRMFSHGQRVGVAVSGGRDSVCLLDLLDRLRPAWSIDLVVLHVNHQLRPEADADEEFVRQLAARRGLPCLVDRPVLGSGNLEQAAREARLRFFEHAPCDRVATAHTASDQAETVLLRILRGAAARGLTGIYPVWGKLVRPLLDISRREVDAWLSTHQLEFREDTTNSDCRFRRNRIRHELLPFLEQQWNRQMETVLCHLAAVAAAEDRYLDELTPSPPPRETDGALVVRAADLDALPLALRRRYVRRLIEAVQSPPAQLNFEHTEAVLQLKAGHDRVILPGADVLRSLEWIRFAPAGSDRGDRNWSWVLTPPARREIPGGGCISIGLQEVRCAYNETGCWISGDPSRPLTLRNWRPGDLWESSPHEWISLKQLFQDHRIPLWERRNWPILEQEGRVIWAGEFGAASRAGATFYVQFRPPAWHYRGREKRSP